VRTDDACGSEFSDKVKIVTLGAVGEYQVDSYGRGPSSILTESGGYQGLHRTRSIYSSGSISQSIQG